MAKSLIVASFVFLSIQSVFSQNSNEIRVRTTMKEIGKNLLTEEPIQATEYTFPDRIHNFQIDTINNSLTIQLRGLSKNGKWLNNKGSVVRYDPIENRVKWSKKIFYERENIQDFGGITIHTAQSKSFCLNNETGAHLWEVKNSLSYVDVSKEIAIGYKPHINKKTANLLEGINLKSGDVLWQRKLNREYGWNNVFYLNDSTLLIVAAGLKTLNINDGTGWSYHTITGKKDHTASAIGTGLGIAAGLLTGMYSVSTGHNLVRDVVSNVIVDSTHIYLASKEKIAKLDMSGSIIWNIALPDNLTSKSIIFKNGNNITMINRGYAYMGYRQLALGTPFIASFDRTTGKQQFLSTVTNEKKEVISGYDVVEDTLLFVFNDRISKHSLVTGKQISEKQFNLDSIKGLSYFIGDQVFVSEDSTFSSLVDIDSTKHYLYTKSGKTLVLNQSLDIEDEIDYEELWVLYFWIDDLKFIAKDNQTVVLDKTGSKIAEFSVSANAVFLNGNLYDKQESSFLEISIANLLDDKKTD